MTIQNKSIIKISDEYGVGADDMNVILYQLKTNSSEKPKKGSQSCKQDSQSCKQSISSTQVKQLTKSEIESLRQNKRDAYELMMKMD